VLTLGSCFATNVERHLAKIGCNVPSLNFIIDGDMRDGLETFNLFAPPASSQAMLWTELIYSRNGTVSSDDAARLYFPQGMMRSLILI
jgi:hypothetical protein